MLDLSKIEQIVEWSGLLGISLTLLVVFTGIFQGLHRPTGRSSGKAQTWLRSPVKILLISSLYFGFCFLIWKPLPFPLPPSLNLPRIALGAISLFGGLGMILWGRFVLAEHYFVSTSTGAQLFKHHRLVTSGPFALVRHPIYLGIFLVGLGGILIYATWTMVFVCSHIFGLRRRAIQEEIALAAEFGEQWQVYCQRTRAWIPLPYIDQVKALIAKLSRSQVALIEAGLMFLPAIPAYLWVWPNVTGTSMQLMQSVTYIYIITGSLFIGLRRWEPAELGLSLAGIWLTLAAGIVILAGRTMVILSVDWGAEPPSSTAFRLLGEGLYYFLLVGFGEELLFRGLLYRAFEEWRGLRFAIWGSSLGFVLWHLFGQGPLVGTAMLLNGLIFALIRWRAGGIIGLAIIHGLIDFSALLMLPEINITTLNPPQITRQIPLLIGLGLIALTPIFLWKIHPLVIAKSQLRHNQIEGQNQSKPDR